MKTFSRIPIFSLFCGLAIAGVPAPCHAGEYAIGLLKQTDALSGADNTDAWEDALGVSGFVDAGGKLVSRSGRFSILRTPQALIFRITSELPPEGDLLARVPPEHNNSNVIGLDDTVEIWLSPLRTGTPAVLSHQLMVNPLGAVYSAVRDPSASATLSVWNHGASVSSRLADGQWHVEASIPLASIDADPASLQGVRFRVARNWRQPRLSSASEAFSGGGYANVETMSLLHFRDNAPAVDQKGFLAASRDALDLHIALAADQTRTPSLLDAEVSVESTTNVAPRFQNRSFDLNPGQRALFSMTNPLETDTDFEAKLQVSDQRGTLFLRQFTFSTAEPESGWSILKAESTSRFRIAYSPYRNLLLVENWAQADTRNGVRVEISDGNDLLAFAELKPDEWLPGPDGGDRAIAAVELPGLEAGSYTVRILQEQEAESHPLIVQQFEWERNAIGRGDSVPPPFITPHTEGDSVSLLLRRYDFAKTALPAQIYAEDEALLVGEATVSGVVNGRPEVMTGRSLTTGQDNASYISQWQMGAVQGQTSAKVAFDGLVQTQITLPAMQGTVIDKLVLRIPLRNADAPLMHSIGAGIRGNYAGAVPAGEGSVWNNLDAMAYGYPDNFIPYMWVGGIRRGLALMADSGSGWSIGARQPSMQLIREGDALALELQIVSAPLSLDQERTVTLYWQATPIKNKPENWRLYSFGEGGGDASSEIRIHGSGLYWGAISSFGDVYPRDADYSYLEQMAKVKESRAVGPQTRDFIEQWNRKYDGLPREERYRLHVRSGFSAAAGADHLVPYTNARGVRETAPEFHTFQDEWVRQGITSRKWSENHFGEIKTDPAPSFQDFALWHFRKMRDIGYASGIYFDNDYMTATANPFTSYESRKAHGQAARPSTGLILLRDYFLRVYRLFSEDGRQPLNIMHMTNAAIAPHLAFATIQLDWEMKYGSEDFQDRFKEDVIFATTLGEQFGTVPLVLSGIYPSREKTAQWLTRSLFATTSVYEIKVWPTFQMDKEAWARWQRLLSDFGYGTQDCEVYRFWEEPPYALNRDDARAIVLRNGPRLLAIVSDFGEGGETVLTLDAALTAGKDLPARDAETAEALPSEGGQTRFNLKKHDFKIIEFGEESAQ